MSLISGKSSSSSSSRNADYNTNAMKTIAKELAQFDNGMPQNQHNQEMMLNYSDEVALRAIKAVNGNRPSFEPVLNGHHHVKSKNLNRKASIERELANRNNSPALDSGAGSSRSDSPHSHQQYVAISRSSQFAPSPCPSSYSDVVPPTPPPRCPSTPSTPPPPLQMQQLIKRMSPAIPPSRQIQSQSPARGTSPVSSRQQPMIVPQAQQQLQKFQELRLYQNGGSVIEPPPPYPISPGAPPPSYITSIQSRQSPTQSLTQQDYRKSPSSGIYSGTSAGSPSPITVTQNATPPHHMAGSISRPIALQPFTSRQTKTQPPIIMHSVRSTQVQKPVLQTAIAPQIPTTPSVCVSPPAPPSYASIQQKQQSTSPPLPTPTSSQPTSSGNSSPTGTEPPSYTTTMMAIRAATTSGRVLF